ncbi:hypothetical protein PENTCL1PPCAC_25701, partial [Pristionchus entomophagus]
MRFLGLVGSSNLCFVITSIFIHCKAQYCVLLAFSFCFRYYVIDHPPPSKCCLISLLGLAYLPSSIVYTCFAATPLLEDDVLMRVMDTIYPTYKQTSKELLLGSHTSSGYRSGRLRLSTGNVVRLDISAEP